MTGLLRRAPALLAFAVLVALVLGAACTANLQKPELTVAGVDLVSASLFEQRLKVRVHVHNPNDRTLPVKSLDYTLEVMGQQAASGRSDTAFVVPAQGDAEFDMGVTTNLAATVLQLLSRGPNSRSQEVPYRISGKVQLSEGFLRSIPFDQRGNFKLQ